MKWIPREGCLAVGAAFVIAGCNSAREPRPAGNDYGALNGQGKVGSAYVAGQSTPATTTSVRDLDSVLRRETGLDLEADLDPKLRREIGLDPVDLDPQLRREIGLDPAPDLSPELRREIGLDPP